MFPVNTDKIHDALNETFSFLRDNETVAGPGYWPRQLLTRLIRRRLMERAFSDGLAVVNDSCNLVRRQRRARLALARIYGYRTVIVWVNYTETALVQRLRSSDEARLSGGASPAWFDLFNNVQNRCFDPPRDTEADRIYFVLSGLANPRKMKILQS
jgi:hypothetical protein